MQSIRRLARGFAAAALLFATSQAGAAEVIGGKAAGSLLLEDLEATIVFGSVNPSPGGVLANGSAFVSAVADGNADGDFALDVFSTLAASAASASSTASGSGSVAVMAAGVTAELPGRARAESNKTGQINFTGSGLLVVRVPYSLQASLSGLADDTGFVRAQVSLNAFRLGSTATYSSLASLLFDIGTGPGSSTSTGMLSLALPFVDGDQFTVIAGVTAEIATTLVPVPPAIWLLGSGILALGVRRRAR